MLYFLSKKHFQNHKYPEIKQADIYQNLKIHHLFLGLRELNHKRYLLLSNIKENMTLLNLKITAVNILYSLNKFRLLLFYLSLKLYNFRTAISHLSLTI